MKKIGTFILSNIHTILFLLGMGCLGYAAFLFNQTLGFATIGLMLIILGIYIDRTS